MPIRKSLKPLFFSAAILCCAAALMTQARPRGITGTPGDDILSGTPYNDYIEGLGGNDTITGGKGADYIYDPYGTNRYKFYLGDVPAPVRGPGPASTDYVYGSGNDRADFYFPIKGRVYLCGGSIPAGISVGGVTIVVYDTTAAGTSCTASNTSTK
jgi:Ca2+-binding RTX toxin-like protein